MNISKELSIIFLWVILLSTGIVPCRGETIRGESMDQSPVAKIQQDARAGRIDLDTELLYLAFAIRAPDRLPEQYRVNNSTFYDISVTPQMRYIRKNIDRISNPARQIILTLLERPPSMGYIPSDTYPLRIHWTETSTEADALYVKDYIENSWSVEVDEWGWRPPFPDYGMEGSDDYDVYVHVMQYSGYVNPEQRVTGIDWMAYTSHMVINPRTGAMGSTCAHEFNHVCQDSTDITEADFLFEQTATYIMAQVYPQGSQYSFLNAFQQNPYRSLDWFDYAQPYQYGGYIWQQFLAEYFDVFGPTFMRQIWEDSKQDGWVNEPDCYDLFAAFARDNDSDFDTTYHTFNIWRYFTGRNDDGAHFSDASRWPPGGEVRREFVFDTLPVPWTGPEDDRKPMEYGASYMQFTPGVSGGFHLEFAGDTTTRWMVSLMGILDPATNENDVFNVAIAMDQTGSLWLDNAAVYDRIVLVVSNISDGIHDPDDSDWAASGYRVRADAQPPATPTPMPTPTPTPYPETGLFLSMPAHHFHPGEPCDLRAAIANRATGFLANHRVVVALDVAGEYWFAPDWSQSWDSYVDSFGPGTTELVVIPPFLWPSETGAADGLYFHGALLDPETMSVVGSVDSWEFGWSE